MDLINNTDFAKIIHEINDDIKRTVQEVYRDRLNSIIQRLADEEIIVDPDLLDTLPLDD
jgi:hypothetical protein